MVESVFVFMSNVYCLQFVGEVSSILSYGTFELSVTKPFYSSNYCAQTRIELRLFENWLLLFQFDVLDAPPNLLAEWTSTTTIVGGISCIRNCSIAAPSVPGMVNRYEYWTRLLCKRRSERSTPSAAAVHQQLTQPAGRSTRGAPRRGWKKYGWQIPTQKQTMCTVEIDVATLKTNILHRWKMWSQIR